MTLCNAGHCVSYRTTKRNEFIFIAFTSNSACWTFSSITIQRIWVNWKVMWYTRELRAQRFGVPECTEAHTYESHFFCVFLRLIYLFYWELYYISRFIHSGHDCRNVQRARVQNCNHLYNPVLSIDQSFASVKCLAFCWLSIWCDNETS